MMAQWTTIPSELTDRITASEGIKLVAYVDSEGVQTLGIGHRLTTPISIRAANQILDDDIFTAQQELAKALPWSNALDTIRYWSLVELVFEMGIGRVGGEDGLLSFVHMLESMKIGAYINAAASLIQSRWASQVHQERAERIANQIKTGMWG